MSLLVQLVLRLTLVALLCLACAVVWIVRDTNGKLRAEAEISAERVAFQLASRPSLGSAGVTPSPLFLDWRSEATVAMILPGVCVEFGWPNDARRRRCNGWAGLGEGVPRWFKLIFDRFYWVEEPVTRPIVFRGDTRGTVTASLDPEAAVARTWQQVSVLLGVAMAMALGMCLLAAAAVGHALLPAQKIIRGLRGLEKGDLQARLPEFGAVEFNRIARAFNDLAGALEKTTAERTALTRRLFQVQEHERRILARDLHDEFGQCLTATSALAASIELATVKDRPDISEDARAISRVTAQMMSAVKGALIRLRPPDLDEVGLEASLRTLIAGWNARGTGIEFRLKIEGDLSDVPPHEALNVYRIAQECLTNAARHGRPSRVLVSITRAAPDDGSVVLVVDDDGGGDPGQVTAASGFGVLGIRERIAALGGTLAVGTSEGGLRISAIIPRRRCRMP